MGKATYYNQKDRDQFQEGWFGQAGWEMKAREKDGSLTLGGIHKKQTDAFEPYATRSTMAEGKTPGSTSTMPPGRTLLSSPTGQPTTAPTIPKIPAIPAANPATSSAITPAATPATTSTPTKPGATPAVSASVPPTYFGQPRRTLLSTAPLEDVPGRGGGMAEAENTAGATSESDSNLRLGPLREGMHGHPGDESTAKVGQGVGEALQGLSKSGEERADAGDVQNRINNLYAEMAAGPLSSEKKAELAQWKKLASIPGRSEDEGVLEGVLLDVAEGLGARKEDFKKHILGQDGSSRLTLEKDPASRVGDYLFSRIKSDFGGNFQTFEDMTDPQGKPMDEDAARAGAVLVTSAELALEMFGGKALKAFPGADKAKKAILQRVVNAAMANDKVRAMVVQGSKQLGEGVESVIVEVSKELAELVTTEASKQVSNANGTEFEAVTMEDVVDVVEDASKEGAKGFSKKKVHKGFLGIFK